MAKIRISYIASEISPILNTTAVGEFVKNLPMYMQQHDVDVRIFVPRFGILSERKNKIHQVTRLSGLNIAVDDAVSELIVKSTSLQDQKLQVYFIDGETHFQKKEMFTDAKGAFIPSNEKRAIFFCRGVLETLYRLDWGPDIIHCHDWVTAFLPVLLKYVYAKQPLFQKSKSIFTAYNNEFNPTFAGNLFKKLNLPELNTDYSSSKDSFSMNDVLNLGNKYADATFIAEKLNDKFSDFTDGKDLRLIENTDSGMEEYYDVYKKLLGLE